MLVVHNHICHNPGQPLSRRSDRPTAKTYLAPRSRVCPITITTRYQPTLIVQRFRAETYLLLRVSGAIDILTAPLLDRHIAATLWSDPPGALIIDLTSVSLLSAAGMQTLLDTHRLTSPTTGLAVITTAHQTRLLGTVGIADTIPTYPCITGALLALQL